MREDVKALWTAALRAPDAKQTDAALGRVDGSRCCLGVLCDLAVEAGVIPPPWAASNSDDPETALYYGTTGPADKHSHAPSYAQMAVLPHAVLEWAGLPLDAPTDDSGLPIGNPGNPLIGEKQAAEWNDAEGKTFPEIADLIERHL